MLRITLLNCTFLLLLGMNPIQSQGQTGLVEVDFLESDPQKVDLLGRPEGGEPLVCRVRLIDERGRALRVRNALFQAGWNLVESPMVFRGRPGNYAYQVFHGPQFTKGSGGFTLDKRSEANDVLHLKRHSDLADELWVGGDLYSQVPAPKTLQWLEAEDLVMAVVPQSKVQTSQSDQGQAVRVLRNTESGTWAESYSYSDQRLGSGLTIHHWMPPAQVPDSIPSTRLMVMAKKPSASTELAAEQEPVLPAHVEIQRLWERDTPIWLASGHVDSIQLLGTHLTWDGKAKPFRPTFNPDPKKYSGPLGLGKLTEYLYWQILEAGFRIPPTAGSGFGETTSPLGYNRLYAAVASATREDWWRSVRDGQTFVTSGPLLRAKANGLLPGSVFQAASDSSITLNFEVKLTVSDPVDYLNIIFNGKPLYEARLDEYASAGGRIPPLEISESGWLVVRVVTGVGETYRIASTAPFYCEVGDKPRISRKAVELFQEWLQIAEKEIAQSPTAKSNQVYLKAAKEFWNQRLNSANAE